MKLASFGALSSKPSLDFFHSLLKSYIEAKTPKSSTVLLRQLLQLNLKPNDFTFSLLLKSSAAKPSAETEIEAVQIQTYLIKWGLDRFAYLSTALLDLCMKLGCVKYAHKLFDNMLDRDAVSWNALICGYSRNGYDSIALELFIQMLESGFWPNQTTLVGLLPSCGQRQFVVQGKSIHGFGLKCGFDLDSQVKNVLTSMYAKFGDVKASETLFEENSDKSVVSWNTMISVYGHNSMLNEAIIVFKRMVEARIEVNPVTIMSLVSSNADPESTHSYTIKTGLVTNESVVTSLVCLYAKCGSVESAEFLNSNNLVSWTAIISGYAEKGNIPSVVRCFSRMRNLDMKIDSVAMVSILQGITDHAHSSIGLAFHGYAIKSGLDSHNLVINGLITMYSKLNDMEVAFILFSGVQDKPLITWNSVITGFVQSGRAKHALELFSQMRANGQTPDAITIASLLSGCSQLGYLHLGENLHNYILRNKLEAEDFVGTALIDMYSKCGSIEKAERVFNSINQPCLATWNTIISAYSWYGLEQKALTCYSEMQKQGIEPDEITFLGVLAACLHGGLVSEGRKYFEIMREEFGMVPTQQHYACLVGLLGRSGLFGEALGWIREMEGEPDCGVWGALLSGCGIHGEVRLGEFVAKKMYMLDWRNGGLYVAMSNLYAMVGRWDEVARVREMMRDFGGDGNSGVSQIELTR